MIKTSCASVKSVITRINESKLELFKYYEEITKVSDGGKNFFQTIAFLVPDSWLIIIFTTKEFMR